MQSIPTVNQADQAIVQSYHFDLFDDEAREDEALRLEQQATVLFEVEMEILEESGLLPHHSVLEIGCGPGFISGAIAEYVNFGHVTGIDVSNELLSIARTEVLPKYNNLNFETANALHTGLPDKQFDFIYNRLLYQHLSEPLWTLLEAVRVAKNDGIICILDIDDDWLSVYPSIPALDQFKQLACEYQRQNSGDRNIGRKLPLLMQQAGLHNVQLNIVPINSLELGIKTFLEITTRFKAVQINEYESDTLLEQIYATVEENGAQNYFAVAGVFVCVGSI